MTRTDSNGYVIVSDDPIVLDETNCGQSPNKGGEDKADG